MNKRKVGILLFNNYVDALDLSGPAEVLSLTASNKVEQTFTLYKKSIITYKAF